MQISNAVLMIRPVAFGFNPQTAVNNYFQVEDTSADVPSLALAEFDTFVAKLQAKGMDVLVVEDTKNPHTPDSIFPNNWVSFHADGRLCLYPMFAENRRKERKNNVLEAVKAKYEVKEIVDFSAHENNEIYLEGTGSIIIDHANQTAYAAISQRLDEALFYQWCKVFGYQAVAFDALQSVAQQRLPIYHTNVMMCVADQFVVICLDSIDDATQKQAVKSKIEAHGQEIIEISEAQMHQFAGNMLQLQNAQGEKFLVMSSTAYHSLNAEQIAKIEQYSQIIHSDLQTIERNGGGSARCMLAEIFLPKKA
jgi:hypothetical protein